MPQVSVPLDTDPAVFDLLVNRWGRFGPQLADEALRQARKAEAPDGTKDEQ